jgi:hypothetical protein
MFGKLALMLSLTCVISAIGCGGSSSPSKDPGSGNTLGLAQGAWSGTTAAGVSYETIILPNDKYYSIYGTMTGSSFLVSGMMTGQGGSRDTSYAASLTDFSSNGTVLPASLSASYVAGASMNGTISESDYQIVFSGRPLPSSTFPYDTPATVASIQGVWTGNLLDGSAATANIKSDGTFTGSDAGCTFSGSAVPDTSGKNFFNVTMTFGASPCVLANQTVSGIGVQYLLADRVTHQLLVALSSGTTAGTVFVATR